MRHMTVQRLMLKELLHMTMYIDLCRGRKAHILFIVIVFQ